MATPPPDRILSLDVIRGIAVMGIFSVNVVGMALIDQAYDYPPAFGFSGVGDKVMWAANFVLVDGKLRALFSILFGASSVLVMERGIAAGRPAWQVHYARMAVLLLFGLAHFYLLWWGDILANYALVGMIAFAFWQRPARHLMLAAVLALAAMYGMLLASALADSARFAALLAHASSASERAELAGLLQQIHPGVQALARAQADHASIAAHLEAMIRDHPLMPFASVPNYGLETLGLMLLGMAGYKGGFLTGDWRRWHYALVAALAIGTSLACYLFATWQIFAHGFAPTTFFLWNEVYTAPLRPVAALGYAALIMVLFPCRGAVTDRVAAVGRAAFTNYLGATVLGTLLFFSTGLGLFGELSRGQAWLIVPFVWAAMLAWSNPWLDRYRYGPFEWAWRSLSRWRREPMRRASEPASRAEVSRAA